MGFYVGSVSPDQMWTATATALRRKISARQTFPFDRQKVTSYFAVSFDILKQYTLGKSDRDLGQQNFTFCQFNNPSASSPRETPQRRVNCERRDTRLAQSELIFPKKVSLRLLLSTLINRNKIFVSRLWEKRVLRRRGRGKGTGWGNKEKILV